MNIYRFFRHLKYDIYTFKYHLTHKFTYKTSQELNHMQWSELIEYITKFNSVKKWDKAYDHAFWELAPILYELQQYWDNKLVQNAKLNQKTSNLIKHIKEDL